jgi:peptidoglycan/LPS O-acetylase OafA/YrhL
MSQHPTRLLELDVFRGLAALAVVLFHYTTVYERTYDHHDEMLFDFSLGHYGVQLFFIISGFVIFMTLNRTKSALDFVVSRFSRLYPVRIPREPDRSLRFKVITCCDGT